MYLTAEHRVAADTEQHQAITKALEGHHLEELANEEIYQHSTYVSGWDFETVPPDPAYATLVALTGMAPDLDSPHFYVELEPETKDYLVRPCAVYWRKANAIHEWFVRTVQDGEDDCRLTEPIHGEVLAELVDLCKQVIETPLLAAKLLPTQGGFFFGSVDYDEWYIAELQHTVDRLAEVINTYPKPLVLRYQSSW
jgi:hypothetical protein